MSCGGGDGGGRVCWLICVTVGSTAAILMLCTKLYKNALMTADQFILFHVMYQLLFKCTNYIYRYSDYKTI